MKRINLFFFFFSLSFFTVAAQTRINKADSLKKVSLKQNGIEKARTLSLLCFETVNKNNTETKKYFSSIEKFSASDELLQTRIRDLKLRISFDEKQEIEILQEMEEVLSIYARIKSDKDFSRSAKFLHNKYVDLQEIDAALRVADMRENGIPNNYLQKGYASLDRGRIYFSVGNIDKAMENFNRAIPFFVKAGDRKSVAGTNMNIGVILYNQGKLRESQTYYEKALAIHRLIKDTGNIAKCLVNIGINFENRGELNQAQNLFKEAAEYYLIAKDSVNYAGALESWGHIEKTKGNYRAALDLYYKSMKVRELCYDTVTISNTYINLGHIHGDMNNDSLAEVYYRKSEEIMKNSPYKAKYAEVLAQLGKHYNNKEKYEQAVNYFKKSIALYKEVKATVKEAMATSNLGRTYLDMGNRKEALPLMLRAEKILKEYEAYDALASTHHSLMMYYADEKNHRKAVEYGELCMQFYLKTGDISGQETALPNLSVAYANLGEYEKAYEYSDLFIRIKDTIYKEDMVKQYSEMQTRFDTESKNKQIQLLEKDKKISSQELEKKKTERKILLLGVALLAVIISIILLAYVQKKKSNQLLAEQKKIVEEKHKEITDSINYAKRIQSAILFNDQWQSISSEYFILFKPKDVVSGDFYWSTVNKNDVSIWAVADCTGHGVPGAFMSMIGMAYLNQIVGEENIEDPGEILNRLRQKIIQSLEQKNVAVQQKDGMDISIICRRKNESTIFFAGANNPCYRVSKGVLTEYKGDKMPVGLYADELKLFTTHEITVEKGDMLYLFSDGYADQFGGEKGKKFMYKSMKELLVKNSHFTANAQEESLEKSFLEWKGNHEQVDDVCIVGVRV